MAAVAAGRGTGADELKAAGERVLRGSGCGEARPVDGGGGGAGQVRGEWDAVNWAYELKPEYRLRYLAGGAVHGGDGAGAAGGGSAGDDGAPASGGGCDGGGPAGGGTSAAG